MVTYPTDWKEISIGTIFSTITDYVAAGSFADLANNIKYLSTPNYAQLVRTRDIKAKYTNRDFVYIDKEAYDFLWRVHFDNPKIIMPNIGNCGEVYYVVPNELPSPRCALGPNAIMLSNTNYDLKFLSYVLTRSDFQNNLKDITSPSGQTKFNKTDLAKLVITIPTRVDEQRAISDTLSTFDEHLENLTKLIEKKRAVRDGALEDLVTGKTRLDGFESHWKTSRLETLTKQIITGGTPSTAENKYWGGEIPWLSSTEIHQKRIKNPTSYITEAGLKNSSAKMTPPYSVVVALAGQGKTRGTVAILEREMALNQSLAAIVANESTDFTFLYYALEKGYEALRELSSGDGGRGGLNKKILREFEVKIPSSKTEQQAIASILTAMDDELIKLEHEKEKIQQIKEGAIDDLLTGKIRLV